MTITSSIRALTTNADYDLATGVMVRLTTSSVADGSSVDLRLLQMP